MALFGYGLLSLALGAAALFTGILFGFELMSLPSAGLAGVMGAAGATMVAFTLLAFGIHVLVSAAISAFVVGRWRTLRSALHRAVRRTGTVLPVALLTATALVLLWILTLFGASLLGGLAGDGRAAAAILLLLSLPALYVALGWVAALPIAAVEDLGAVAALRASWRVMEGHRPSALLALGVAYGMVVLFAVAAELLSDGIAVVHPLGRLSLLLLLQTAAQAYLAVVPALLYQKLRTDTPAVVPGDTAPDPPRGPRAELGLGVALRASLEAIGGGGLVLAAGFSLGALTEHRNCVVPAALVATVVYWIVVLRAGMRARGTVPILLTALGLAAVQYSLVFASVAWSEYAWKRHPPEIDLIHRGIVKMGSPLLVEWLALIPVLTIVALAANLYRTTHKDSSAELASTRGA
jgi:hypothetical protein